MSGEKKKRPFAKSPKSSLIVSLAVSTERQSDRKCACQKKWVSVSFLLSLDFKKNKTMLCAALETNFTLMLNKVAFLYLLNIFVCLLLFYSTHGNFGKPSYKLLPQLVALCPDVWCNFLCIYLFMYLNRLLSKVMIWIEL